MPKSLIREDDQGKFIQVHGVVVRPVNGTSHDIGDNIDVQKCTSTIIYGVGKDDNCGRGEYNEAWYDTGVAINNESPSFSELHEQILKDYPVVIKDGKFSFAEVKSQHKKILEEGSSQIQQAMKTFLDDGDYTLSVDDIRVMKNNERDH